MAAGSNLRCQKRDLATKAYLKGLRKDGLVPGVIYGQGDNGEPVIFDRGELFRTFHSRGARGLFTLRIKGDKAPVLALLREMQRNPISGEIVHIDFMKVNIGEKISAAVAILVTGEEDLTKNGGVFQLALKEVQVECLPGDLPDSFSLNVANAQIGDKILVSDLARAEGVDIMTEGDTMVAVVLHPAREEEPEPAAEETPAEGENKAAE